MSIRGILFISDSVLRFNVASICMCKNCNAREERVQREDERSIRFKFTKNCIGST